MYTVCKPISGTGTHGTRISGNGQDIEVEWRESVVMDSQIRRHCSLLFWNDKKCEKYRLLINEMFQRLGYVQYGC